MNIPKYIVIHCSDVSEKIQYNQLNSINTYHRDERQFPLSTLGYWVGYHYLITGGEIYQCRLDSDEGAHCNQGFDGLTVYPAGSGKALSMNLQSIGICWGGDGDLEHPSTIHYNLLQKKIWDIQDKYNIPNMNVFFHRKFSTSKTCPGSLIIDEWLKLLLTRQVYKPIEEIPTEICTDLSTDTSVHNNSKWYNLIIKIINFLKLK